eukprot:5227620-Ditylum_brightwellii.AAC.1
MERAVAPMKIPKQYARQSPLRYFTLYHPLENLQRRMTQGASQQDRDNLLAHPEAYIGMEEEFEDVRRINVPHLNTDDRHHQMSSLVDEALHLYTEDELVEASPTPLPMSIHPSPQQTTKVYAPSPTEKAKDLQKALHSILNSNSNAALLNAPRSNPLYRLDNDLFYFSLCRQLRAPIHTRQVLCPCKQWIDVYGDHYFD